MLILDAILIAFLKISFALFLIGAMIETNSLISAYVEHKKDDWRV